MFAIRNKIKDLEAEIENLKKKEGNVEEFSLIEGITNNDNKNISLTILDINGKIISTRDYHFNGTMKLPIFVNNLEKGIYIVKLSIGESVQQQKLIVQ